MAHNEEATPDWIKEIDSREEKSPYPAGFLQKMSMKQLKRERIKQIGIADDADLDDPAGDLASSRLTYVLCEIDIRQCKGKSEITR
jgi:hypothetical protein